MFYLSPILIDLRKTAFVLAVGETDPSSQTRPPLTLIGVSPLGGNFSMEMANTVDSPVSGPSSFHPRSSSNHDNPAAPIPTAFFLPVPSTSEIPPSRPYTAVTMASARTSTTQVDLDTAPPFFSPQRDNSRASSRNGSRSAIGQSMILETEAAAAVPQIPQTSLTFLLVSGRRRTMSFDPDTTVGRVKELVWNAWPSGRSQLILSTLVYWLACLWMGRYVRPFL